MNVYFNAKQKIDNIHEIFWIMHLIPILRVQPKLDFLGGNDIYLIPTILKFIPSFLAILYQIRCFIFMKNYICTTNYVSLEHKKVTTIRNK